MNSLAKLVALLAAVWTAINNIKAKSKDLADKLAQALADSAAKDQQIAALQQQVAADADSVANANKAVHDANAAWQAAQEKADADQKELDDLHAQADAAAADVQAHLDSLKDTGPEPAKIPNSNGEAGGGDSTSTDPNASDAAPASSDSSPSGDASATVADATAGLP